MSSSYSSPKIKRSAGKGKLEKMDSPKNSKTKRKTLAPTAPIRVRTRYPTRNTVSFTIQKGDSPVDGFAITAYLPQSGWKKLKVPFVLYVPHINTLVTLEHHDQLNMDSGNHVNIIR